MPMPIISLITGQSCLLVHTERSVTLRLWRLVCVCGGGGRGGDLVCLLYVAFSYPLDGNIDFLMDKFLAVSTFSCSVSLLHEGKQRECLLYL